MYSELADFIRDTSDGQEAAAILKACVHCGFCTATCPTYQLLGDELDGPRGRIYLIKQVLEGKPATEKTQLHLDRCLTCRACETTCPSGVKYGHLLDIGRKEVEKQVPRRALDSLTRFALKVALPRPWLFKPAVKVGQLLRPLLPAVLSDKLPLAVAGNNRPWPTEGPHHSRRMLMLAGCVQPALAPNINAAMARVLDRLGIRPVVPAGAGCCGALRFHLNDHDAALNDMRRNIDIWWPYVQEGVEAIVVTASGCGVQVKDYGHALRHDPDYADRAARVSALCRDPSEILAAEKMRLLPVLTELKKARGKLAFHSPCTLQHGMQIRGVIEEFLAQSGYELVAVKDSHLCCGSAGTYAILQPELSHQLRDNKLKSLMADVPERVATANIGCLTHLQPGSTVPVVHWIELIDEILQ